jgi:hypothetical protein
MTAEADDPAKLDGRKAVDDDYTAILTESGECQEWTKSLLLRKVLLGWMGRSTP